MCRALVVVVVVVCCGVAALAPGPGRGRLLSRQRRYLTFPEGATFNLALCMSNKARVLADTGIFTEGVAWGCSYDLPNNTQALASAGAGVEPGAAGALLRRKDRTDLYRRVERAVDSAGLDGHLCMLRAVCEAENMLSPRAHLVMEMLRIALAMPLDHVTAREPQHHRDYIMARHNGLHGVDCGEVYPQCPISLLGLATSLVPSSM
ncbi:Glutamate--tRNA ligase [Frankliniella fusca]|uniref:Glutamate--tRNA ligase n=1 Tax=Frankliniella fusca TaxID=407009 RepID=A0AAE1GYN9_9NEOP|nr:Glutamate--tRNA ligase [Frankliniella fusca]